MEQESFVGLFIPGFHLYFYSVIFLSFFFFIIILLLHFKVKCYTQCLPEISVLRYTTVHLIVQK